MPSSLLVFALVLLLTTRALRHLANALHAGRHADFETSATEYDRCRFYVWPTLLALATALVLLALK